MHRRASSAVDVFGERDRPALQLIGVTGARRPERARRRGRRPHNAQLKGVQIPAYRHLRADHVAPGRANGSLTCLAPFTPGRTAAGIEHGRDQIAEPELGRICEPRHLRRMIAVISANAIGWPDRIPAIMVTSLPNASGLSTRRRSRPSDSSPSAPAAPSGSAT